MKKNVNVRAFRREGFSGFFRGGHKWPDTGANYEVSEDLLAVLRREPMLAVSEADGPASGESRELQDNRFDDRAWNASASARAEHERLKAERAVLDALVEVDKLKAENEALKAQIAKPKKAEKG